MPETEFIAPPAEPDRPVSRRRFRVGRFAAAASVVGVLALVLNGCITTMLVDREDKQVPRDPVTGIMLGAEAYELGPADAPGTAIFVHGFAGTGNNFNQVPRRLADRGWRVRVLRLPGHGTSPRDLESVTANQLLDAVVAEVRESKKSHDHVVLIGHSMGGALSTLAAAQEPVDGIVLGGAYFGVTHRWYYGLRPETWTRLTAPLVRWVYKGDLFLQLNKRENKEKVVCYAWLPSKAGLMLNELGRRVNEPETLSGIDCAVLMIHSHGDVAASPQAAERAFNAFPSVDKRILWVDASNHHVYWDYDAEQVASEIEAFVATIQD